MIVSAEPSVEVVDNIYDEDDATVLPVPASPSTVSVKTSTPPGSPSSERLPCFIDDILDLEEEISVHKKLDIILENQKVLFKLLSEFIQERRDTVYLDGNKGLENSGRFSSTEVSGRVGEFSNTSSGGDELSNTSLHGGGLNSSTRISGRANAFSNTSIGGDFSDTIFLGGPKEMTGGLNNFSLVSGGDVTDTGEEGDSFLREAVKIKSKSCGVENLAQKILKFFFQPEELCNRNCTGTRGKEALDSVKLGVVKSCVFKLYPCTKAHEDAQWRKCVTCIDEFLRRKKKYFNVRED